ncbi:NAD(P)H-binding protein [Streptomyces sp. SP18ES09]|uniref:NAD(P)H-binding protein n=1 Tax=Streptomyces sp. SP18ES09 TaxID=3002532 RepID=UPI002E7A1FEB|nr:NAD(P)H-binding protein [Streptomyces sp. SP18ES09]MEE1816234.1 NAD(P)H-binding protein [Streptomyces sp. SP18ES09]
MILVTGATGTVGREVARLLAPAHPVRVLTRRPELAAFQGPDVTVVRGGFTDPESLHRALTGVHAAFLVTNRVTEEDDARFIEAARARGVRHLVKLSAAAVEDPEADDLVTRWQRANERTLRESGLEWTLLRPRSFMSNTLSWASAIRSDGVVRALYGGSANACVDPRDIAEVAVHALTGDGKGGRVHALSGPAAVTALEQTAVLSEVLGRPLRFEELGPERARSALLDRYPEAIADALMHSAERQRAGAKARVDSAVPEVLGRPARTFATWAADHAGAFA